jgi:riboflavin-specific deaminase-like protein
VRQLFPGPDGTVNAVDPVDVSDSVDPVEAYGDLTGDVVRLGMVASVDGSATDDSRWTDGLGGTADLRVFRTLRAWSDAILVGAATIRTGRVGPHRPSAALRAYRLAEGRAASAPLVVVSQSLRLDWSHRLFTEAASPTIVVTSEEALSTVEVPVGVVMVVAGEARIELATAVRRLRERGLRRLLCEGGPQLATGMLAAGLIDEVCLSLAPTLVGTAHHTRLINDLATPVGLSLYRVYEDDGVLFLRYHPKNPPPPTPQSPVDHEASFMIDRCVASPTS